MIRQHPPGSRPWQPGAIVRIGVVFWVFWTGTNGLALLNTSFNVPGWPFAHIPDNAYEEARIMGIRYRVVNGRLMRM